MPKMYAYNTSATQLKKRYGMIGSTATQIKKRYAMIGSTATLVYSAEEVVSRSVTVTQQATPNYGAANDDYTVPSGYTSVTLSNFSPGQSYGWTVTEIFVMRGGSTIATLRNVKRAYSGSNYVDTNQATPVDSYTSLQDGDVIRLRISASYDPNVSAAHDSTASVTYTFE